MVWLASSIVSRRGRGRWLEMRVRRVCIGYAVLLQNRASQRREEVRRREEKKVGGRRGRVVHHWHRNQVRSAAGLQAFGEQFHRIDSMVLRGSKGGGDQSVGAIYSWPVLPRGLGFRGKSTRSTAGRFWAGRELRQSRRGSDMWALRVSEVGRSQRTDLGIRLGWAVGSVGGWAESFPPRPFPLFFILFSFSIF
jgi:hypothetical protein